MNAVHLWVPGYTISQRRYIGITFPLRMDIKIHLIQRNACFVFSCAQDLVLGAYLPELCNVSLIAVIES